MKTHNKYAVIGLKALQRAATKVAEEARKNNYKIPIWKNGRIEYEIPGIIPDQRGAWGEGGKNRIQGVEGSRVQVEKILDGTLPAGERKGRVNSND